jgi:cobalt/nickel transport system permease protein
VIRLRGRGQSVPGGGISFVHAHAIFRLEKAVVDPIVADLQAERISHLAAKPLAENCCGVRYFFQGVRNTKITVVLLWRPAFVCRRYGPLPMHIPDGYLSPSTCAVLYGAAIPFWYVAFARVKRLLHTRLIPLLAVASAFCFVIMMFNVPLPGGTTGHAVGVGAATVVLGPWAAMLSVSIALLIQAVFFGDGGITTFGANCFNMAIIGSLVAYLVYRVVAGGSAIASPRRVVAGALAGYAAINVAAFFTACELGVQPLFFKDATGAPLYAPYALHIAIPAMMIGHLTFAGLAELFVSGGVVAYLQRSNAALLGQKTSRGPADSAPAPLTGTSWGLTRPLWLRLALLMLLTPLGILAAGTAWGEWGARDFSDPQMRQHIAAASHNVAPPIQQPHGLAQLSTLWSAPFPQYAPSFVRRPAFGYVMSAVFGSGLILGLFLLIGWMAARQEPATSKTSP